MRISLKSGMAKSVRSFHSSGPTLTRTSTARRASASATSGMRRTTRTRSSLNVSVNNVALAGWTDSQVPARSRSKITRAPPIIPIAKTPTAIESTTRAVRVLLANTSANTLRQRGLSMVHLPLARGDVLAETLIGDAVDRLPGHLGLADQVTERRAVERRDLDCSVGRGADAGDARAAAQQPDLAEVLARAERRDDDVLAAGVVQEDLDLAFGDDVKAVGRLALGDDRRSGRVGARLDLLRDPGELIHTQRGQRLRHVLVDDLAVSDDHRTAHALSQVAVVCDHQDGLALRH